MFKESFDYTRNKQIIFPALLKIGEKMNNYIIL